MLKRLVLLLFFLLFGGFASAQVSCISTGSRCINDRAMTVDGIAMEGVCTTMELEELCEREVPVNECEPFIAARVSHDNALTDGQCRQISRECIRYRNGECDRWLYKFTCWNGPIEHPPADLEDRIFHNFEEEVVNDCDAQESNPNCTRTANEVVEDYQTRVINGMEVTRAWWRRERTYDCTDPTMEETCGPFENNPICAPTGQTLCLRRDADGTCIYQEVAYDCRSNANFEANCAAVNVCVGDNCTGAEQDPSNDYPKAAAWLNVLDSLADDFGCNKDGTDLIDPDSGQIDLEACPLNEELLALFEPELFTGELMSCNRGTTDCCDFDGDGFCSQESLELADHRLAKVTHYLESECTSELLGVCLSVQEYYCVYKTRFARIFQEKAHLQTGQQFRSPSSTNPCPALDIFQIETLDVAAMDFSEIFGEMIGNLQMPIEGEISDRLIDGVTIFGPQIQDQFRE